MWHAATFAVAAFAVILQLVLVLRGHQHLGDTESAIETAGRPDLATRLVRFCSYLTIWFNVLVAATTAVLVVSPCHDGRIWRVLRLDALVIATGGGLVHWFALRPLLHLHGADRLADRLLHIVVPLAILAGWLAFGPRGRAGWAEVRGFVLLPVVWLAYTLIRGAIVNWYPYPFLDVTAHGYRYVFATSAVIAVVLVALAIGFMYLDRLLPPRGREELTNVQRSVEIFSSR
jgi:hypothetical protein